MFDTRLFRPGAGVGRRREWQSFRARSEGDARGDAQGDPLVFQMGEDIALASPFGVTTGLADEFGRDRVRDAPCSEVAVVGAAVGAAIGGMRPSSCNSRRLHVGRDRPAAHQAAMRAT
ncbi:MAG: hypothetical protein U1F17_04960 [Burkholderiaceae bacterium]